jgi:hypothetical protein
MDAISSVEQAATPQPKEITHMERLGAITKFRMSHGGRNGTKFDVKSKQSIGQINGHRNGSKKHGDETTAPNQNDIHDEMKSRLKCTKLYNLTCCFIWVWNLD